MLGRLHVGLMNIIVGSIKIFTPQRMSMVVIFAVHNAKIFCIVTSHFFNAHSLRRERINWFAHLPIIFVRLIKIVVLSFTVKRRFINVLKLIGMLSLTAWLIKILLVVEMRLCIIFTWHHMEVVNPFALSFMISRLGTESRVENASGAALKT